MKFCKILFIALLFFQGCVQITFGKEDGQCQRDLEELKADYRKLTTECGELEKFCSKTLKALENCDRENTRLKKRLESGEEAL